MSIFHVYLLYLSNFSMKCCFFKEFVNSCKIINKHYSILGEQCLIVAVVFAF